MPQFTGDKNAGRFYVKNISKDFIVPYNDFDIEEESSRLVDRLKIQVGRNSDIDMGDELAVFDNANNEEKIFGGYVSQLEEKNDVWNLEVDEYIIETVDKRVKRVFRDVSPEDVLQDLIGNETTFSFNAPVDSNFTLDKYVIEGKIEEAIKDMTELLEWQARTTPQKELYFEPVGRLDSNQDFTHGDNCVIRTRKTKDSDFVNTVELEAGRTNYRRTNSFTGDGSQTEFELTEQPVGSVNVEVDGTEQEGAISEDLGSGDDFYIDAEQPSLIFASAPGNGASISIVYTYEVPILVRASTEDAKIPSSERKISTKIKRKWIKTFSDARKYAEDYVENHSSLLGQIKFFAPLRFDVPVGKLIDVQDSLKNIDDKFVVERKTISSDGYIEITAGDQTFNSVEWRNSVVKRLKELEQRQTTDESVTVLRSVVQNLDVDVTTSYTVDRVLINDTFIVNHPVNGVVKDAGNGQDQVLIDDFEP